MHSQTHEFVRNTCFSVSKVPGFRINIIFTLGIGIFFCNFQGKKFSPFGTLSHFGASNSLHGCEGAAGVALRSIFFPAFVIAVGPKSTMCLDPYWSCSINKVRYGSDNDNR